MIGAISPAFVTWALGDPIYFNPVMDGLALGISNGVLFGVLGGSVLVVASAIAERKG